MEPSPTFWEKVVPRIEERLERWKAMRFDELAALPESSSDGEEVIDGRNVHFSAMCWHRQPDEVIIVIRASVKSSWMIGHDYDLGFVMNQEGKVHPATREEVRSLW